MNTVCTKRIGGALFLLVFLASCSPPKIEAPEALKGEWTAKDGDRQITLMFTSRGRALLSSEGTMAALKFEFNEPDKSVKLTGNSVELAGVLQDDGQLSVKITSGSEKVFGETSDARIFERKPVE